MSTSPSDKPEVPTVRTREEILADLENTNPNAKSNYYSRYFISEDFPALDEAKAAGIDIQKYIPDVKKVCDALDRKGYAFIQMQIKYFDPSPDELKKWIEKCLEKQQIGNYHTMDDGDLPVLGTAKAAGIDISGHLTNIRDIYFGQKTDNSCFFRMVIKYCDLTMDEKKAWFEAALAGGMGKWQALNWDPSYMAYLLRDSIKAGIIGIPEAKALSQEIIDKYLEQGESFLGGKMVNALYLFEVGFENDFLNPQEYTQYFIEWIKQCRDEKQKESLIQLAQKYGIPTIEASDDVDRIAEIRRSIAE